MSDPQPQPKRDSLLSNPQVLVALIGGLVTIVVAIVGVMPALLQSQAPTPTVVVVTATPLATDTPAPATDIPAQLPTPTLVPLEMVVTLADGPPPITAQANVTLMYDGDSFSLMNGGGGTLSLEGVIFRSTAGQWEARAWGVSIYTSIPAGKCVRLRDSRVGDRLPPAPCRNNIYGLQLVGASALFWVDVDSFEVVRNGEVIATCTVSEGSCLVSL